MDIEQAINRVERLSDSVRKLNSIIAKTGTTNEQGFERQITVSVFVCGSGSEEVACARDAAIDLLCKTRDRYQAEIDRLQPVIDMANAALKGIGV